MGNYFGEDRETQIIGRDYGGGGSGAWCMILLVVVILWVLFNKDGHGHGDHGYGYPGYGYAGGCGPCVQPTFKDESNFEEERNINSKLCCIDKDIWNTDKDVWKTACETQQVEHCEAEKTRALIQQDIIQNLRDKNAEKDMIIQTMESKAFTKAEIGQVLAAIGCTNQRLEKLECEVPKRQPVWAESVTPNTHHTDCDRCNYPRRGKCDSGCNDGYGFGYAG